jgi:hypothetical protein
VRVAHVPDAILVPAAAVQHTPAGAVVWLVKDGRAARRSVQPGIETDTLVQILSGIAPGETVIVAGAEGLRPGDPVDAGRRGDRISDFGFRISDWVRPSGQSEIENPKSEIARSGAERRWA